MHFHYRTYMATPSTKTRAPEVMKFTIVVDPSLVIITTLHIFIFSDFQRKLHFQYMTYMATPQHKDPCPGGHEIYNFGGPFFGHHYCTLSLSVLCLRVEKRIFFLRNNVFSLYNLYGHTSLQEPLPRGHEMYKFWYTLPQSS